MSLVKFCGLSCPADIAAANQLLPEFIGFVFAQTSKRYISIATAAALKSLLNPGIKAVGVFVDENPSTVAYALNTGVIDLAQLHGSEDEAYIQYLRTITDKPLIQAFRITSAQDIKRAQKSSADYILLDSGAGTGASFDWSLIEQLTRPYFLAGGLTQENVVEAIHKLHPFAVDVSSGIETDGMKDSGKMSSFLIATRKVTDHE